MTVNLRDTVITTILSFILTEILTSLAGAFLTVWTIPLFIVVFGVVSCLNQFWEKKHGHNIFRPSPPVVDLVETEEDRVRMKRAPKGRVAVRDKRGKRNRIEVEEVEGDTEGSTSEGGSQT